MQTKEGLKNNFRNKKTKKKQLKAIIKHNNGNFGPDDGSFKKKHKDNAIIDAVLKEGLEDEFKENKDII